MSASRIESLLTQGGATMTRVDGPGDLPSSADVDLVIVDWGDRGPDWGSQLVAWRGSRASAPGPRIILFGPHTDLEGHAAAREAGLGPVQARSAFFGAVPKFVQSVARD
jgi:hypothetical protein